MTKVSILPVQLYPHSPQSLIPLLKSHLPGSLRVYGTITLNPEFSNDVYTTFPPNTTTIPEIWVVILPLPAPVTDQIRIYCSLDDSGPSTKTDDHNHELSPELHRKGTEMVIGALERYRDIHVGVDIKVGGIGTLWTDALRAAWGVCKRPVYWYWLAPEDEDELDEVVREDVLKKREGLMVDIGRDIDVDIIQSTCDIKRPREYYQARLGYTTTVRPIYNANTPESEIPQAVCWIVTHTDGTQGALYTMPDYRRRGLAKWVTEERLKIVKRDDPAARGFVCVAQGNEGSEKLWQGMGWIRGWSVEWVYQ